jgi:hypothetical protein
LKNRLAIATELGLETVPVMVTTSENLGFETIVGRTHLTKSSRAWLAVTTYPEVLGASGKIGRPKKRFLGGGKEEVTMTDLARRSGVSRRLIEEAVRIYEQIQSGTLKKDVEMLVWSGTDLAALNRVTASSSGTGPDGKRLLPGSNPGNLMRGSGTFAARWANYVPENFSHEERSEIEGKLRADLAGLSPAAKDLVREALNH